MVKRCRCCASGMCLSAHRTRGVYSTCGAGWIQCLLRTNCATWLALGAIAGRICAAVPASRASLSIYVSR